MNYLYTIQEYSREYLKPLNNNDCQTFLSPVLYEANLIWFKHSNQYGLKVHHIFHKNDYTNISEIIKYQN